MAAGGGYQLKDDVLAKYKKDHFQIQCKGRPARPEEVPKFSGPPENYSVAPDGTVWCLTCGAASGDGKDHVRSKNHLKRL
eukprot:6546615-Lingulodinium_polyedra.AAC.1